MPDPETTVDALMRAHPAALAVMIRWRMLCIGCPIGGFHTIAEACAAHGHEAAAVLADLAEAIAACPPTSAGARRLPEAGRADR
nr:DUF1858 domain-containing protein [Afifella sp. IM 167]